MKSLQSHVINRAILISILLIMGSFFFTTHGVVAQSNADPTKVGVNTGDKFTFVLERYSNEESSIYEIGKEAVVGEPLKIQEGDKFNITVVNNVPYNVTNDEYLMSLQYENLTHSANHEGSLNPFEYIALTD